jgi:hypothetical protein
LERQLEYLYPKLPGRAGWNVSPALSKSWEDERLCAILSWLVMQPCIFANPEADSISPGVGFGVVQIQRKLDCLPAWEKHYIGRRADEAEKFIRESIEIYRKMMISITWRTYSPASGVSVGMQVTSRGLRKHARKG